MTPNVTRNFATAGGMTDVDRTLEIESFNQGHQVVRIGIQITPVPRLTGSATFAAVVSDAEVAAGGQKEHLILEGVGGQRPATRD